jgi:hypothetical protein
MDPYHGSTKTRPIDPEEDRQPALSKGKVLQSVFFFLVSVMAVFTKKHRPYHVTSNLLRWCTRLNVLAVLIATTTRAVNTKYSTLSLVSRSGDIPGSSRGFHHIVCRYTPRLIMCMSKVMMHGHNAQATGIQPADNNSSDHLST